MDLQFIYGSNLDGRSFPEQPALGVKTLGPLGLLHELGLRLGLLSRFPSQAVRIGNYLALMKQLDDGGCFYSRSFKIDPWGTARAVLQLRDELVGAGWHCRINSGEQRIDTLAKIERQAPDEFHLLSLTDLFFPIIEQLKRGAKLPITKIVLTEKLTLLPPNQQKLFGELKNNGVTIEYMESIRRHDGGDIDLLASALTNRRAQYLEGDGTFTIIEADDEIQAADFLGDWLAADVEANNQNVIIKGRPTSFLDRKLHSVGLPSLGGGFSSPCRGTLQLLTLALDMCWQPANPTRIVELLMLPFCPVPRFAADCFIKALRGQPGIGGVAWAQAWEKALERKRKSIQKDNFEINVDEELKSSRETWAEWLEPNTYDTVAGIPASQVVSLCQRVRNHTLKFYSIYQEEVLAITAAYCDVLASAVQASKQDFLPRAQLDRILESVLGDGYVADRAEASEWSSVDHPGQIYGEANTVIWWGFVKDSSQQRPQFWSTSEIRALKKENIELETSTAAVLREAESWRQPILTGARKVILIRPRTVEGRTVTAHPFYHELLESLDRCTAESKRRIFVNAGEIYNTNHFSVAGRTMERKLVTPKKLPSEKAIWKVQQAKKITRKESPSSLEKLFGCPQNWFMRYAAEINPGTILTMAEGEQLAGNLAHAIFAEIFSSGLELSADQVVMKAEESFDRLCPKIAAPLLQPGKGLDRSRLRKAITEAAADLNARFEKAAISSVSCEQELTAEVDGVEFGGRPDMLLHSADGRDFVLDLKWARRPQYRRREIAEGKAVQLALYAWLNERAALKKTAAGYYMLAQRQIFSTDSDTFPTYTFVDGPSLNSTAEAIFASHKQHLAHIDDGILYATGLNGGIDQIDYLSDEDNAITPVLVPGVSIALEPPCTFCDYGRLCGKKGLTK